MFERYTEEARKSVFYARYEASQCGSKWIEPAHVLAGLLQADGALALRVLGSPDKIDEIRGSLLKSAGKPGETVDLPFSQAGRRVLAYAAEESERMNQRKIGSEHMLIGLIRESGTPAAEILHSMGVTLESLRTEASRAPERQESKDRLKTMSDLGGLLERLRKNLPDVPAPDHSRDLTVDAMQEKLDPLIGREEELERVLQSMLRRHRNWVAVTGEPGVGKTALLFGLAQRISLCTVHPGLCARRVVSVPAALLNGRRQYCGPGLILCVEGLLDLSAAEAVEAIGLLEGPARKHDTRIIATGSHEGMLRLPGALAGLFEEVELAPPSEAESIRILAGVKEQYEKFHLVSISDDALAAAVEFSRLFRSRRVLPDRALDLLDDACAKAARHKQEQVTRTDVKSAAEDRWKG